jgi:hypothetical protein
VSGATTTPVSLSAPEEDTYVDPIEAAVEALIDGQEEHSRILGEIARWLAKISKTLDQTLDQVQTIASRLGEAESRVAGVEMHLDSGSGNGKS